MKQAKERSYSFVVRIWVERRELKDAPLVWRGEIEDVQSQERHFFQDYAKLVAIVRRYVQKLLGQPDQRDSE